MCLGSWNKLVTLNGVESGLNNLVSGLAFNACNTNCFKFQTIPFGDNKNLPILSESSLTLSNYCDQSEQGLYLN